MPVFHRDDLIFQYRDEGRGLPLVLQHGLGGDIHQPFGLYRPPDGVRLIAFDMRAHGETRPVGDEHRLTIATLADDLAGLLDHLQIDGIVAGGISLGAAVAVDLAVRYPGRVRGLVLVRPAWIDRPLPENVERYATIARLIRDLGLEEGLARFRTTLGFLAVERESPDCARSLVGQFGDPRARECVARLERLAADSLLAGPGAYGDLDVPTLILGNRQDPIHPWELAESLAELIPAAELGEVTPKSVSLDQHAADVRRAIDRFLAHHFGNRR